LQGQQGAIIKHLHRADRRRGGTQVRLVDLLSAGIDDESDMVAAGRDHEIVDDAAVRVGEIRVALPAWREAKHVGRDQTLERQGDIRWRAAARPQRDLAHMRDVEKARGSARVEMLLHHARRILDGHFVAGEGSHARAHRDVQIVERGALQRRLRGNSHRRHRPAPAMTTNAPARAHDGRTLRGESSELVGSIGTPHQLLLIVRCPLCIFA
jgi:hypothetical protein